MSPLTKVFVVLLVIVSLLQTAGTVVFVNKITPLQASLAQANLDVATARNQASAANQSAAHLQDLLAAATSSAIEADKASKAAISYKENQISQLTVQNAQLTAEKTELTSGAQKSTQDLNWFVAANTKLQDEVKKLRDANDGLIRRQEEDSRKIAELTNLSDTTTARYNNSTEQLQLAQDNIQKYRTLIKSLNHDPDEALGTALVPTGNGLPPINGRVQETSVINGAKYVTINVGSADGVLKGMKFNVIDAQGNFLCFAYIEKVDINDAIGKLDGQQEKISQVQVSDDVKTQIRGS